VELYFGRDLAKQAVIGHQRFYLPSKRQLLRLVDGNSIAVHGEKRSSGDPSGALVTLSKTVSIANAVNKLRSKPRYVCLTAVVEAILRAAKTGFKRLSVANLK
jgi:hypothetical protein